MTSHLDELRRRYMAAGLDVASVDPDPFAQFGQWMEAIVAAELPEPEAMVLATASGHGLPAARLVLLKGIEAGEFRFYTNYESAKAADLAANPRAALVFPWYAVQRQVRVSGTVARLSAGDSDAYFASRPRGAQIGAWASPQSEVIADRADLEAAAAAVAARYREGSVPRPPHWGGFAVRPETFEFWQGRTDRLHDRIRYRRNAKGWERQRLAP